VPRERERRRTDFDKLVWVYVALQTVGLAADAAHLAGMIPLKFGALPELAAAFAGLAWTYRAWARLPDRLRIIDGYRLSPTKLALRHFIPLYGIFWLFRAQHLLCGALDVKLIEKEDAAGAPTGMAGIAGALQLANGSFGAAAPPAVRLAFGVASTVAWTVYMLGIEQTFARAFRKRAGDGAP
jgi:hypothetical protein